MNTQVVDILKFAWPLIVLQLGFQIYCIVDLARRRKTKTLNFAAWLIIIILGEIIGSLLYLLLGRSEE